MPATGYCQFLATQHSDCYCLRADLGLEPGYYIFQPDYSSYRPVGPQDSACGLFSGMNRWSRDEEDFVELFNGLVAANCLSDEQWLSRNMYLWDCRIEKPEQSDELWLSRGGRWDFEVEPGHVFGDPTWLWTCADFLKRSRPLWLALYRRGCHIGSYCDPGGIMGWLTPAEVRTLHEAITVDLPPPPFERPKDYSKYYDAWMDYELYDDLQKVAEWCKRAASTASGLAGSYMLFPKTYDWARIRPLSP